MNRKYYTYLIHWPEIIIWALICLFSTEASVGGSKTEQPEKIYVDFDRSFYLIGETVYFKIYFLNDEPAPSKIVHVDLVDFEGNIHMEQLLEVKCNNAYGNFTIPYDLDEGNYLFRCYTRWSLGFGRGYIFYKVIPIYNEFLEDAELLLLNDSAGNKIIKKFRDQTGKHSIIFSVKNSGNIHRRESIKLELETRREGRPVAANLSLTVREISHPLSANDNIIYFYEKLIQKDAEHDGLLYQPEDSITIKGIVKDPETGKPLSSRVLSVYNVKEATFTRLVSKKGKFEFKMPIFNGTTDLQVINMNPFQPRVPDVIWIPLNKELGPNPSFPPMPERTAEVKEYILYARLRNKINEIFYQSSPDSIELQQPPLLPFIPDRSYDMSEYQLVRNVIDFFKEGVINTSFFKVNGEENIRLFNTEKKNFFMTSPWFTVDGHFIFNDSLVHNIPFNHLNRIDVYNTNESIFRYFEPIMIQGGVVSVYTKNNFLIDYIRAMPNTIAVNGIPERNIQEHKAGVEVNKNNHETPDLSPLIYWNPIVRTDENGSATLSFQTNDVTGTILLEVQGMDINGRPLYGIMKLEVKP